MTKRYNVIAFVLIRKYSRNWTLIFIIWQVFFLKWKMLSSAFYWHALYQYHTSIASHRILPITKRARPYVIHWHKRNNLYDSNYSKSVESEIRKKKETQKTKLYKVSNYIYLLLEFFFHVDTENLFTAFKKKDKNQRKIYFQNPISVSKRNCDCVRNKFSYTLELKIWKGLYIIYIETHNP